MTDIPRTYNPNIHEGQENVMTCDVCHKTFVSAWSQEEAEAEYDKNFPEAKAKNVERGVLCSACYREFLVWMSKKSPEERQRILRGEVT